VFINGMCVWGGGGWEGVRPSVEGLACVGKAK
jgi:hypothetical protein